MDEPIAKPRHKGGRPRKTEGIARISLHFYADKIQEDWLNMMKARTGKSWGEILDALVADEARKGASDVE